MKFLILLFALGHSLVCFASSSDCDALKEWRIRLALTTSNLKNLTTTRTPEGGPYKPFVILSCSRGGCTTGAPPAPVLRYMPGHLDANKFGFVAFPRVDTKVEYVTLQMIANKLKYLADSHTCGSNLSQIGETAFVHYTAGAEEASEDDFTFDAAGNLVAWSEVEPNGQVNALGFAEGGKIIRH